MTGALDFLERIHRTAANSVVRGHALAAMLSMPERADAIAYLSTIARAPSGDAVDAVRFLVADAIGEPWGVVKPTTAEQSESSSALRALAAGTGVVNADAARLLAGWLSAHHSSR